MKWINNVSALQLFSLMRFATLILIGIILVKAGYSTSEIGIYELFFFISNVVSFFWVMGLNNGLISYYPKQEEKVQESLLFNIGIMLLGFACLAAIVLYFFQGSIARIANISGGIKYMGWIIAYMLLSAPGNFTEYLYLLKGKSASIVKYAIVLFSIQLALITFGVFSEFTVEALLKLMVAWAAIKFVWFWTLAFRYGDAKIDWRLQWLFITFSFPLILHMLLGNGMEYVDGFLVSYFFDEAAFAQFRYGARELPLVTILVGAISTALIPLATQNMKEALEKVKKRISKLANILFPVSILLMLTSTFIFRFFYSEDFILSAMIFNVYLLVLSSRILMPQVILFARHNNMVLLFSALCELVVNVALSLFLLSRFGIIGIAWATVVAYMLNKLILMGYAWRSHRISPSEYLNVKLYVFWLSLLVITYYISTLYN